MDWLDNYYWIVPCAVLMDIAWGDPRLPWRHPVCYIGLLLNALKKWARHYSNAHSTQGGTRFMGVLCLCIATGTTGAVVYALTHMPVLGYVFALYFAFAGLAAESLARTGEAVVGVLENAPLVDGQTALALLVTRDTSVQDAPALRKSLADTLAENCTDAVVAPIFWLFVGGPVGLWMYKAVSTMDSMWGYKTPAWLHLGWAGARMDDVLAYIPARLAVVFMRMADKYMKASLRFGGIWPGLGVIAQQARGMESPNSGWPMAAGAWIYAARMGGPTQYFGTMVYKPWVGPQEAHAHPWDTPRLLSLCRMVRVTAVVSALCLYAGYVALAFCVSLL